MICGSAPTVWFGGMTGGWIIDANPTTLLRPLYDVGFRVLLEESHVSVVVCLVFMSRGRV